MIAAPRRVAVGVATASSPPTCTTRVAPGPRQDRRAGGARSRPATRRKLAALGQAARHARRRRQPAVARRRRASTRRRSSASARCWPSRPRQSGKPDDDHRQDGRGPPAQILRGGRAARAGLRHRRRDPGRQGRRRRPPRRSARRSRLAGFAPLRAGRGHREASRATSPPRWLPSSGASRMRPGAGARGRGRRRPSMTGCSGLASRDAVGRWPPALHAASC